MSRIVENALTAQFHGSVLRPDLTQNSAKRVLKSNTPRKQFCLQCTFPRLVFARRFARARGRIIMKFPTRAPRLKLLSRSFGSKQKYFSVRRNIFEFHFRSQKCEHIWLQNWAVELQGNLRVYYCINISGISTRDPAITQPGPLLDKPLK